MKMFNLDDTYTVNFDTEIFLLEDFKKLRDGRKKKIDLLYKEMSYIYFYSDLSSDFQFQTDKEKRKEEIKKYVNLPDKWEPDTLIENCISTYKYLSQTVSSRLLESVYIAVDKIRKQLVDIDLNERDKNLRPIWNPKQIKDNIKDIPDLLESIKKAEAAFIKGQDENEKLRGEKIKTLYEDGLNKK